MQSLFSFDSPFMKKLGLVGNLALLNILWLICCLPVFTIGAATTAMHAVLYKYIENTDDEVARPFFTAFCANFKQATILWLPFLAIIILLVLDALYLYTNATGLTLLLWIPFAVIALLWAVIMTYAFPILARYDSPNRNIIRNSGLLFVMDLVPSVFVLILNLVPWVMFILWPDVYMQMGLIALCFSGSAISYWNDKILLRNFKKRQQKEEDEEEVAEEAVV